MDRLAELFDAPPDSVEHQELASTAYMGGPLVSVRYWLGRISGRNFFREPDSVVNALLVQYLREIDCRKGAILAANQDCWGSIADFLQHQWCERSGSPPPRNGKWGKAMHAVLTDPDITHARLASLANTTEKQVERMSDVKWVKELWRRRTV